MAMGYPADHVFEIAIYSEQCAMKGRVCVAPEKYFGDDWRDTPDLFVFKGTEAELVKDALETMNQPRVGMHDFKSARSVLEYLGVEFAKHEGVFVLAENVPQESDED